MPPTLNLWRTGDNGYTDYSSWLLNEGGKELISKTHALNSPQQLKFTLTDGIAGFIAPDQGNRVQVLTQRYGTWFQGYLSQIPTRRLLGQQTGQNLFPWSERYDMGTWQTFFINAPVPNSAVDPYGNMTAEALIPPGGGSPGLYGQLAISNAVVGQPFTFSIWLRVPSSTKTVNITSLAPGTFGTVRSITITTTWQRFSVTDIATATSGGAGGIIAHDGSWTAGEIDAWGAQFEVGMVPGDYIHTNATPATSTGGGAIYAYDCVAVSEELRLEWKTSAVFPTLPPFANMVQNDIVIAMMRALDTGAKYTLTSTMLTNSGFSGFNAVRLVDGFLTTSGSGGTGFSNNTTNAGSTITIDLGAGNKAPFVTARLYLTAGATQTYHVLYSDNGSTFVDAAPGNAIWAPTATGWNSFALRPDVGPHRYWRLQAVLTKTEAALATEMEFWAAIDTTPITIGPTGIRVPFFRVRPDESFMDAVRRLSDKTYMAFWTKGGAAYYQPYASANPSAAPFPFAPNDWDAQFDPYALDVQPVQNAVFNDVFAQGIEEPQAYATEHFPGDGLTAQFPLKLPMYGMTSQNLLVDDFTSGTLDLTKWKLTDVNAILSFAGGSLSMVAASSSLVSRVMSILNFEIAGAMDFCAGRVTFAAGSNALIGCLMGADTGVLADVLAGFQCLPAGSQTQIMAVANGAAFGNRYVTLEGMNYQFRLTVDCTLTQRLHLPFFSLLNFYGPAPDVCDATITYSVVESSNFNPDGGVREVLSASVKITSIAVLLYFMLVGGPQNTSDAVNLALNFCSIRKPAQASLWMRAVVPVELTVNGDFETSSAIPPVGWTAFNATLTYDTTTQHKGARSLIVTATSANGAAVSPVIPAFPGGRYTLSAWMLTGAGAFTNVASFSVNFYDVTGLLISTANLTVGGTAVWAHFSNTVIAPDRTVSLDIRCVAVNNGTAMEFDDLSVTGPGGAWTRYRLGDKSDPLARALITTGPDNNALLEFIGDQAPQPMEKVKVLYRSAGIPRVRVQSAASVTAEAAKSGDSGIRTGTLPPQTPGPRNAVDLEMACQAYIDDRTRPLFSGKWTVNSKAYPSNFLMKSQTLNSAAWVGGGAGGAPAVTNAAGQAPDGTNTASQIVFPNTSGGESFLGQDSLYVPVVGRSYTFSAWLRAASNVTTWLRLVQSTGQNDTLVACAVTTAWQRFSVTVTPAAVGTGNWLARFDQPATNPSTTVLAWGAQLELGATVNGYVATDAYPAGEPFPGSLISVNATSRFAPFQALVTEVDTRLILQLLDGTEYFEEDAIFGPLLRLDEVSVEFQPADEAIVGPLDQLQPALPIDISSIGSTFAYDLPGANYLTKNNTWVTIDAGAASSTAFEVRKTDAAWGTASTINKALTPDPVPQVFSIARIGRDFGAYIKNRLGLSRVSRYPAYLRFAWPLPPGAPMTPAYTVVDDALNILTNAQLPSFLDGNNLFIHSEEFEQSVWFKAAMNTVTANTVLDPNGNLTADALVSSGAGDTYFYQGFTGSLLGETYTFSIWLRVPSGTKTLNIVCQAGTTVVIKSVTLTTTWTRYTVSAVANASGGNVFGQVGGASTWATGEVDAWGAQAENAAVMGAYLKSVSVPSYGRLQDVFGYQIRDDDDLTVLYDYSDILLSTALSPPALTWKWTNPSRLTSKTLYARFYNLLGEYSDRATFTISTIVPSDPTAVTCTSGSTTALTRGDGIRVSRIKVAWTASTTTFDGANGFVDVEYSLTGINAWQSAAIVAGDKLIAYVTGIDDGIGYDVRIRSRNANGGTSGWVQVTNHVVNVITHGALSYRPTSNPLTAHDAGATVTINIAAWVMRIAGVGDKSYTASASITGLSYSTFYYVYYDDSTLAAGAVTVSATTNKSTAFGTTAGRYFLGSIMTPAAGAFDTVGNNDGGVGAQGGSIDIYYPSLSGPTLTGAGAVISADNGANTLDGDQTTYTEMTATADGVNLQDITLKLTGPSGIRRKYSGYTVKVLYSVPTNAGLHGVAVAQWQYPAGGAFNQFITVPSPTTAGLQIGSAVLPSVMNMSQLTILLRAQQAATGANGDITKARYFDAWIEAEE